MLPQPPLPWHKDKSRTATSAVQYALVDTHTHAQARVHTRTPCYSKREAEQCSRSLPLVRQKIVPSASSVTSDGIKMSSCHSHRSHRRSRTKLSLATYALHTLASPICLSRVRCRRRRADEQTQTRARAHAQTHARTHRRTDARASGEARGSKPNPKIIKPSTPLESMQCPSLSPSAAHSLTAMPSGENTSPRSLALLQEAWALETIRRMSGLRL